jgi:hypothetical protein
MIYNTYSASVYICPEHIGMYAGLPLHGDPTRCYVCGKHAPGYEPTKQIGHLDCIAKLMNGGMPLDGVGSVTITQLETIVVGVYKALGIDPDSGEKI